MFFSGIADEAGDDIQTQIKAHKELGWHHIELRKVSGVAVGDLSDRAFDETAEALSDAGIAISDFGSQLCNWARPITTHLDLDRHELARSIPRMQRTGCPFIRIMSYPNAGWPEDEWKEEVFNRIKVLAQMAEDGGVTLVHENCNGYGGLGPAQTLELLEHVDSPALKLVFDTGNTIGHGQDSWDYYSQVKEHVVYVHIKDARKQDGKTVFTFPGEGDGKVARIVKDLLDSGYEGGISIEPHLAAIVHEGKAASESQDSYALYLEYGRRLMRLVDKAKAQ